LTGERYGDLARTSIGIRLVDVDLGESLVLNPVRAANLAQLKARDTVDV
jgi:hypothetical protein